MAHPGEHGKPRPALVIQANEFPQDDLVAVLPITSVVADAKRTRVDIPASPDTGLRQTSQVAINRVTTISSQKIGRQIGVVDDDTMARVSRRLAVFLGIAA